MWFLGFPIFSYLGSGFSSILTAIDLEYSRETPKLLRGMRDKLNVTLGDQAVEFNLT